MIRLLQYLFLGHVHEWEIIDSTPCSGGGDSRWTRYYLKCKKCGTMKTFNGG